MCIENLEEAQLAPVKSELLAETLVGDELIRLYWLARGTHVIHTHEGPIFEDKDHRVFADMIEEYFPEFSCTSNNCDICIPNATAQRKENDN